MPTGNSIIKTPENSLRRSGDMDIQTGDQQNCIVQFLNKSVTKDGITFTDIERENKTLPNTPGDVDYLPTDLLLSLAKPAERFENLGPTNKLKGNSNEMSKKYTKKPADNAWNHPQSREKLKHLVEQTPCICGAGRDISFLYDLASSKRGKKESGSSKEESFVESIEGSESPSSVSKGDTLGKQSKSPKAVCDTLVPSEFHVVKNPGVLGLEYHDEKYVTKTDNHEHHLTLFPSLKPAGRQEVLKLKHTMNAMLKRAGVEDDESEERKSGESDAPTQIHELLELVKQEQTIYNVVFSELIRQVTVECLERGELLTDLRKRYAKLLDKVPRRVKSLHEEVLAQRALDRRLTEELTRFKSSISVLTKELNEVQAHDREVTKQAKETQEQLKLALKESEKNASLLSEYHELYELQRKRLEHQITSLIHERDLWAGGSYLLALKVAMKHNLTTSKRLHLHEKAWHKLGSYFSMLLNNQDSVQLQSLNGYLQEWQDVTLKFNKKLCDAEGAAYLKFKKIQTHLTAWGQDFYRVVTPEESTVHVPDKELIQRLCDSIKSWEEIVNLEAERFTGDFLLSCEDDLLAMNRLVDKWTDVAVQIFSRHPQKSGAMSLQHERMLTMNSQVEVLHRQFKQRMTGENGVAKGLIHLINVFGTWINKLSSLAKGGELMLDPEWVRLADFIQNEWPNAINALVVLVAPEDAEEDLNISKMTLFSADHDIQKMSTQHLRHMAQLWMKDTTVWVENEGGSLIDKITSCHSSMVRWMVTVLQRLAPDFDLTEIDSTLEKENIGIGAAILSECISETITQKAALLIRLIKSLTKTLKDCLSDIVMTRMQEKKDSGDETAELEYKDFQRIQTECNGWINTANTLVKELTGEFLPEEPEENSASATPLPVGPGTPVVPQTPIGKSKETPTLPKLENAKNESKVDQVSKEEQHAGYPILKETIVDGTELKSSTNTTDIEDDGEVVNETEAKENQENELEKKENNTSEDNKKNEENEQAKVNISEEQDERNSVHQLHFIGMDENTKTKSLDEILGEIELNNNNASERPWSAKAVESLSTIDKLRLQLLDSEKRAQVAEDRAIDAEIKLKEALERVRALERAVSKSGENGSNE